MVSKQISIAFLKLFVSIVVALLLICPVLLAQYGFTMGVLFYHNAAEKKLISRQVVALFSVVWIVAA
jgi:alpha-N-acetylglucosamine transferase